MMDISDSGFVNMEDFSSEWSDITLLQQRRQNTIYTAKRYGKRYLLKAISPEYQSLTDIRLLQEKEFALGISLNHSNIAETYSLEEVPEIGRCIVMEYVDGMTLAQWLNSSPTRAQRERVLAQLLEVLEYIHSMQLVHHDLKSSNILITRNGQNVKLIDFGLSQTDAAHLQNDVQVDIDKFVQVLSLLFPKRYHCLPQRCQKHPYANLSALRAMVERQERIKKHLPYFIAIIILIVSVFISIHTYRIYQESEQMAQVANEYAQQKQREEEMLEKMNLHVNYAIESIKQATQAIPTYYEIIQHPILIDTWNKQQQIRDSIANEYIDDPVFYRQYIDMWTLSYSEKLQQLYDQWAKTKPKY